MNNKNFSLLVSLFCWGLLSMPIVGCSTGPFSGSAAMQIEVEVYKGPLSHGPEIQWAEILGHLNDLERALIQTDNLTRAVIANKNFKNENSWSIPPLHKNDATEISKLDKLCDDLDPVGLLDIMDTFDCLILTNLVRDVSYNRKKIGHIMDSHKDWFKDGTRKPFEDLDVKEVKQFLSQVSQFSASLQDTAFRWAVASAPGQSMNLFVRITLVNSVVTLSEAGNKLKNRTDALMKQVLPGLDRRELPPSVALRESEPTDFINLYKWINATSNDFISKYYQRIGTVEDRVKIIERLFSDHYWSKINTVYASGRGKVSMAFIKDDVGNWNLKSFDNDPADLLQAYTTFSIEAIKKATEMVAAGSSGGTTAVTDLAINQLIEMANQNSFNSTRPIGKSGITGILSGLSNGVFEQLNNMERELEELKKNPEKEIPDDVIKDYLNEIQIILNSHSRTIDVLGKGLIQQP